MTINEIISKFLLSIDRSDNTLSHYKKVLGYWRDYTNWVGRGIQDITAIDILSFIRHLKEKERSPATIDNYTAAIRSLFAWLDQEGLAKNVTRSLERQTGRHTNYTRLSLAPEDLCRLIDATTGDTLIRKRDRAIILLMSFTGLRCIEVQRLDNGDMKKAAENWYLQIQRKGEYNKGSRIMVPDSVAISINEYIAAKNDGDLSDGPLFRKHGRNPGSTERISSSYISKIVKAYLIMIGFNNRQYCAHSLRHSAACLASSAGSQIEEIAAMLGHSQTSQTNKYLKSLGHRSGVEDKAIARIDEYWKNYLKKRKENQPDKIILPL